MTNEKHIIETLLDSESIEDLRQNSEFVEKIFTKSGAIDTYKLKFNAVTNLVTQLAVITENSVEYNVADKRIRISFKPYHFEGWYMTIFQSQMFILWMNKPK